MSTQLFTHTKPFTPESEISLPQYHLAYATHGRYLQNYLFYKQPGNNPGLLFIQAGNIEWISYSFLFKTKKWNTDETDKTDLYWFIE